jgi:hypothetical protein
MGKRRNIRVEGMEKIPIIFPLGCGQKLMLLFTTPAASKSRNRTHESPFDHLSFVFVCSTFRSTLKFERLESALLSDWLISERAVLQYSP